jgi:dTMP kinase
LGKLITLEGPEGAGKSTQCAALVKWLCEAGYDPVVTREPGGTELGRRVRQILLETELNIAARAEILLYAADRAQHVEKLIVPALEKGQVVVCDRYFDSTMAYQGYARQLGIDFVEQVNKLSVGTVVPDLTLLFDIPVEEGMARKAAGQLDRMEKETLDFHRRVREGYLRIAESEPARVKVIDARNNMDMVTREAIKAVAALLNSRKG